MDDQRFRYIDLYLPDMDLFSGLRIEINPKPVGLAGQMQLHVPALGNTADDGLLVQITQVRVGTVSELERIIDGRRCRIDKMQVEVVNLCMYV